LGEKMGTTSFGASHDGQIILAYPAKSKGKNHGNGFFFTLKIRRFGGK
jgi:hypothetical protein